MGLPQVSLVIINRNYASYIGATLRSITQQTYPWSECLIVDNGSTDDSLDVIRDHIGDDPRFELVELDCNYGHLGAALQILDRLKGEFVCFVDADDVLFPQFLASHVQVHLAGREMVALTSSNVIEIDGDGRLLNGGLPWLKRAGGVKGFRAAECIPALPMLSTGEYEQLVSATWYFDANFRFWLWGPGTSNMYRRSVINLLVPTGIDEPVQGGVDCFLNYFSHALTGTSLINVPLSAYRIHGKNHHARRPSLWGLHPGMPHNVEIDNAITTRLGGMYLERTEQLSFTLGSRFWSALDVIGAREFRTMAAYHRSLIPAYVRHYDVLIRQFGQSKVQDEMRCRLGWRDYLQMERELHQGGSAMTFGRRVLAIEWRNRRARVRSRLRHVVGRMRRKFFARPALAS